MATVEAQLYRIYVQERINSVLNKLREGGVNVTYEAGDVTAYIKEMDGGIVSSCTHWRTMNPGGFQIPSSAMTCLTIVNQHKEFERILKIIKQRLTVVQEGNR